MVNKSIPTVSTELAVITLDLLQKEVHVAALHVDKSMLIQVERTTDYFICLLVNELSNQITIRLLNQITC